MGVFGGCLFLSFSIWVFLEVSFFLSKVLGACWEVIAKRLFHGRVGLDLDALLFRQVRQALLDALPTSRAAAAGRACRCRPQKTGGVPFVSFLEVYMDE